MPSTKPLDYGDTVRPRRHAAPAERICLSLGQFTANTTVNAAPRVIFDRAGVIREMWVVADAIPADPDGTMLLNVLLYDASEAGSDTIVSSADLETLCAVANKAYELTLATETSENELTFAAGDSLRATLVNNSAALGTNANITIMAIVQYLDPVR